MAATNTEIVSPSQTKIKLLKWKVKKGSTVFKGSVLALYSEEGNDCSLKLKANNTGTVVNLHADEGEVIEPRAVLLTMHHETENTCSHPTIMKDMCAECGADLRRELGLAGDRKTAVSASVAMVHSIPELIVSQEQALELGKEDEIRLLRERKLVLLVDLDQTLIHTTNDNIPNNLKDVKHFQLFHGSNQIWYHTRFRPFTQRFLKSVSKMYELHICTFGVRMYAHIIARLLDPEEKYFSHRILSRDECFDALSKTANLKALFPCGDTMVGIIDDREDVWNHAPNLVHVKPYRFFQGTADINAPPGLTKAEHDNEPISHKVVDHSKDKQEDNEDLDPSKKSEQDKCLNDSKPQGESEKDSVSHEEKSSVSTAVADDSVVSKAGEEIESKELVSGNVNKEISESKEDGNKPSAGDSDKLQDNSDVKENTDLLKADEAETASTPNEASAGPDEAVTDCTPSEASAGPDEAVTDCTPNEASAGPDLNKNVSEEADEIEWEDEDDYLLHLEEILTRIHKAYYEIYEQSQKKEPRISQLPDLKNIIPYVKKKVLKGANIVFSGMHPLNVPPEKSKAYTVAKALGAEIQKDIIHRKSKTGVNANATTHLVVAKAGTSKHKTAVKVKGIHIVSGDWLWACSERWEWVDEALFPLSKREGAFSKNDDSSEETKRNQSKKRKKVEDDWSGEADESNNPKTKKYKTKSDSSSSSVEKKSEENEDKFANSYNPLYSFSDEDIEFMDKEVDEMMAEDDRSSDESDEERNSRLRKDVLGMEDSDSDSDSLSGDFPRGLKLRRKSISPKSDRETLDKDGEIYEEDEESELDRYQKTLEAFVPQESCSDSDEDEDSVGSVDDEIAEAVEREFLGSI